MDNANTFIFLVNMFSNSATFIVFAIILTKAVRKSRCPTVQGTPPGSSIPGWAPEVWRFPLLQIDSFPS